MNELFTLKKEKVDLWYKEPWMLLVLGGPLIVIIAAIITFYIAWQGSDNVVSRDYYKQGINIDKTIHRDAKAGEYKMLAHVKVDATGQILLQLVGKTLPETITMTVSSYARSSEYENSQKITLTQVKAGQYDGLLKIPSTSGNVSNRLWYVIIEGPDWRLTADWRDPLNSTLQLKPQN